MTLSPVTSHFVLDQLLNLNLKKRTGLDGLSPRFLRDEASVIKEPVTHIVNLSILMETVPQELKNARVSPLFKKGPKLDVGNYRPVSILNVLCKILQRAVFSQFDGYLTEKRLLYDL
jgi:hypothetical protein